MPKPAAGINGPFVSLELEMLTQTLQAAGNISKPGSIFIQQQLC